MKADAKIIVAVRKRPLTKKELAKNETDIVDMQSEDTMTVKEMRQKVDLTKYIEEHMFTFDAVFSEREDNEAVYTTLIQPLVASAFAQAKVTCFAYGQTGSGKTFTMMGDIDSGIPGLYLLAASDIFKMIENPQFSHIIVGISFYEIYCGKAHDLLNSREQCPIRVDAKENVNVVGLKEKLIVNTESLMALIHYGLSVRITGTTGANDDSSRSHAILQITLRNKTNGKLHGKMSFIDLAGSERGADVTDTNKQTRMDGAEINKSLLALKECIRALDLDKKHLPFRGSKLTLVLKDSFVGNCKTVMIGNISPAMGSCEHTLNTLRYADRVKELKKYGDAPRDEKDKLARALMLPRMNKNSNKIVIDGRKTVDDNIVFEAYDVRGNAGNKINVDAIKPKSQLEKAMQKQPDVMANNGNANFQDPNAYTSRGRPQALQRGNTADYDDNYDPGAGEIDVEEENLEVDMSPPTREPRQQRFVPQPYQPSPAHLQRGPYLEAPGIPNTFGRGPSPLVQRIGVRPEPPGNARTNSDNNSMIRKNVTAEENNFRPPGLLPGKAPQVTSFITSANKNNSLLGERSSNLRAPPPGILNRSVQEREPSQGSFVPRGNRVDQGQSSSKKMQIESNESRDFHRDNERQNDQQNSRTFELLLDEQDELIEEHSNQIDDLVACVKEDMAILKNVKDARWLTSDRPAGVHLPDQDAVGPQNENPLTF